MHHQNRIILHPDISPGLFDSEAQKTVEKNTGRATRGLAKQGKRIVDLNGGFKLDAAYLRADVMRQLPG